MYSPTVRVEAAVDEVSVASYRGFADDHGVAPPPHAHVVVRSRGAGAPSCYNYKCILV
jgi:hypothetical protein